MKKLLKLIMCISLCGAMPCIPAFAGEMSNYELMQEIKDMKERMGQLEEELQKKERQMADLNEKATFSDAVKEGVEWTEKIGLSGAIEVEFGSEKADTINPVTLQSDSVTNDDIALSTFELGLDMDINRYAKGHVTLLYEEDEDADRLRVDEATLLLGGTEDTKGFYLLAGKYCPHFGELNTWFVSDPVTQVVFEAGETALEAGFEGEWVSLGAGVYHGDIEDDFEDDGRINGFFGDVNIHNPEGTLGGVNLLMGLSYINNVADSDTLQDEVQDINIDGALNDLDDTVGGVAAYFVCEFGIYSFGAEYITALDDFRAGEMGYSVNRVGTAMKTKPSAYNLELAMRPIEPLQVGLRYEGTSDMYGLVPEKQYGIVGNYDLFENMTLSGEFLHGEYDEDNQDGTGMIADDRNLFTVKLAVEF